MSQFQTLICSRDSPLNRKTLIFVVFIDATIDSLCKLFFEQRFSSYVIKYVYLFLSHHETLLLNYNRKKQKIHVGNGQCLLNSSSAQTKG